MAYCENYIDLISASLDGALSPAEQETLKTHLAQCPECRALYDDLTVLRAGLADLPPVQPPADLTERIMGSVAAEKVVPFPRKKDLQWKKWMASAAVLALVMVGAWSWSSRSVGSSSAMPESVNVAGDSAAAEPAPKAAPPASETPEPASASFQDSGTPAGRKAAAGVSVPESAAQETALAEAPEASEGISLQSVEPTAPMVRAAQPPLPTDGELTGPVAPRLFSAPLPPAENGEGETPEESLYGQSAPIPSADTGEIAPSSFALTSVCVESAPPVQTLTAQEAAQALANYIYEFVEQVEPVALGETEVRTWRLSSPTGVSGTAVLDEETDLLFRFTYQDEAGGESLSYTVDKASGKVLFLPRETSD